MASVAEVLLQEQEFTETVQTAMLCMSAMVYGLGGPGAEQFQGAAYVQPEPSRLSLAGIFTAMLLVRLAEQHGVADVNGAVSAALKAVGFTG